MASILHLARPLSPPRGQRGSRPPSRGFLRSPRMQTAECSLNVRLSSSTSSGSMARTGRSLAPMAPRRCKMSVDTSCPSPSKGPCPCAPASLPSSSADVARFRLRNTIPCGNKPPGHYATFVLSSFLGRLAVHSLGSAPMSHLGAGSELPHSWQYAPYAQLEKPSGPMTCLVVRNYLRALYSCPSAFSARKEINT